MTLTDVQQINTLTDHVGQAGGRWTFRLFLCTDNIQLINNHID